jgi:thiosulfate/3-mercaptopyruvate sulfurtransferase
VDVRSTAEYRGEVSGYGYLQRAGRIPGAVHAGIGPLTALLGRGDVAGIGDYWRECGVDFRRREGVIFYCGSGWRSSVACLAAARLGVQARNYSNGWCGWSTHYVRDASAKHAVSGATPGWRQDDTGRPVARG